MTYRTVQKLNHLVAILGIIGVVIFLWQSDSPVYLAVGPVIQFIVVYLIIGYLAHIGTQAEEQSSRKQG